MKKISVFIIIFFWLFGNIFAQNALLEVEKTQIATWEKFSVVVTFDDIWDFVELKWSENFQIISQSQSTSSMTQMTIINGETKQENKTIREIFFTLSPLSAWEFQLWPAIFQTSSGSISSNVVKIQIMGRVIKSESLPESNKGFLFTFLWNPIILIFFLFFLWLLWYWYSLFQNNKKVFAQKMPDIPKKEIIFPLQDDIDFEAKMYDIFIKYLEETFYGKDFYYKTLSEITSEIDKTDFPQIHEIIELLQKVKYSPDKSQKKLLLEKLQQIIKPH